MIYSKVNFSDAVTLAKVLCMTDIPFLLKDQEVSLQSLKEFFAEREKVVAFDESNNKVFFVNGDENISKYTDFQSLLKTFSNL